MRRDEDDLRTRLQTHRKQIIAIQFKNRPAIRTQIANALQLGRDLISSLQRRQDYQTMHLAGLVGSLENRTNLPCHYKAYGGAESVFEPIESVLGWYQPIAQLATPAGVGAIPGTDQSQPFPLGPLSHYGRNTVFAGRHRIMRMEMQISIKFH